MEFKAFPKITKLNKIKMTITQKIHGTNAQIVIQGPLKMVNATDAKLTQYRVDNNFYLVRAGSRNRWITPENDNYGFADFVDKNAIELINALGEGQHFGEWAGPGINSGEGLKEKTLCLFDAYKYLNVNLPKNVTTVPILYSGELSLGKIEEVMADLKKNGSKLVPGFMRPEGVVVNTMGTMFKKVFKAEETQWTDINKTKTHKNFKIDYSYLLQPIRLEKLISRDENYTKNYPQSLKNIVVAYIDDLIEENIITGDDDQIKLTKKNASKDIFNFVKTIMDEKL